MQLPRRYVRREPRSRQKVKGGDTHVLRWPNVGLACRLRERGSSRRFCGITCPPLHFCLRPRRARAHLCHRCSSRREPSHTRARAGARRAQPRPAVRGCGAADAICSTPLPAPAAAELLHPLTSHNAFTARAGGRTPPPAAGRWPRCSLCALVPTAAVSVAHQGLGGRAQAHPTQSAGVPGRQPAATQHLHRCAPRAL
jgi:hypothetical protein